VAVIFIICSIDKSVFWIFIALFPIMLFLYQKLTNDLVNLGKVQANNTAANVILGNTGGW